MLARIPAAARAASVGSLARVAGLVGLAASLGCAHRPAMCSRTCDDGFACVAGECLRTGTVPDVEAVDKFGLYKARRLVLAPTDVVRLAPGDDAPKMGAAPRLATLGRARDASSLLLLRFALDLPPDVTVLDAQVVLDRAPAIDADPTPIALHAARISEPWDAQRVSWGRAPRLNDARSPLTTVDDARSSVRIDVRLLVQRWRRHAADDQGIAIVADRASVTGIAFALEDCAGASEERAPPLPVRTLKDTPPTFHTSAATSEGGEVNGDARPSLVGPRIPRGPRLELYVRP